MLEPYHLGTSNRHTKTGASQVGCIVFHNISHHARSLQSGFKWKSDLTKDEHARVGWDANADLFSHVHQGALIVTLEKTATKHMSKNVRAINRVNKIGRRAYNIYASHLCDRSSVGRILCIKILLEIYVCPPSRGVYINNKVLLGSNLGVSTTDRHLYNYWDI